MLGISVTIDTPSHVELILSRHHFHAIDLTVTLAAVETERDVRLVTEPSVVWKIVDLDPFDGLA